MAHEFVRRHMFAATLTTALLAAVLVNGCGGGTSLFLLNKNTQAIWRDTATPAGMRSTLVNPQDSVNGFIRLAPVEQLGLVPVQVQTNGHNASPFDVPRTLMVPPGFSVSVVAAGLNRPRDLVVRDDGTIFYADFDGKIVAVGADGRQTTLAEGLKSPHGIELANGVLYYTDEFHVYRFEFSSPTAVTGTSKMISDKLPPGGMHYTRSIRWKPNDKMLYVAIGSTDNKSIEDDNQHATMLRLSPQGGTVDAATRGGLRDVMAMDVHPETGDLWVIDNGTELLSMLLPPTEVNIIKIGKHYGWPFYYSQNFRDPEYANASTSTSPRFPSGPTPPVIELEGHSDATGMRFYTGTTFGADWKNSMIVVFHGTSKVLRVRASSDGTNGRQADFLTGFADAKSESVWGNPVGVAIARDGSAVYVTDDRAGAIYKISRP